MTCPDNTTIYAVTLTRLTFVGPDGTEYELRDQATGGQPQGNGGCGGIVHESLHFAGLKDRYKEKWSMSQKRQPASPTKGYDNSNIMTSNGGTTLKPEQIKEAKNNNSTKKCTTENGVTKCN